MIALLQWGRGVLPIVTPQWLQWGRERSLAELTTFDGMTPQMNLLQWGRERSLAELSAQCTAHSM